MNNFDLVGFEKKLIKKNITEENEWIGSEGVASLKQSFSLIIYNKGCSYWSII